MDMVFGRGLKKPLAAEEKTSKFWVGQPVPQASDKIEEEGPVETKTLEDVQKEPYSIASVFEWFDVDVSKDEDMEAVYRLLYENYVEDDDSCFRFNYSKAFLRWALTPPGYYKEWLVGVRKKSDKKMLAFISGVPMNVRCRDTTMRMCEINFLCVHKLLRDKKLAPILIKEVTRRVNLCNIWQAVYTAGVQLTKPVAVAQYFHRSLNPEKLIAVKFSRMPPAYERFAKPMEMLTKQYSVAPATQTKGLRPMVEADVPQVTELLTTYLAKFPLAPAFDEEEVKHWILPVPDTVYSYVVEDPKTKKLTDMMSFYNLPSTVIGVPKYDTLRAAYMYYYVANSVKLEKLLMDALILAKQNDFDVFNALDIQDNAKFFKDLKFGPGDGNLRYYLYNWKLREIQSQEVGLVML